MQILDDVTVKGWEYCSLFDHGLQGLTDRKASGSKSASLLFHSFGPRSSNVPCSLELLAWTYTRSWQTWYMRGRKASVDTSAWCQSWQRIHWTAWLGYRIWVQGTQPPITLCKQNTKLDVSKCIHDKLKVHYSLFLETLWSALWDNCNMEHHS